MIFNFRGLVSDAVDEQKIELSDLNASELRDVVQGWEQASLAGKTISFLNPFDVTESRAIAAQELLANPQEVPHLRATKLAQQEV